MLQAYFDESGIHTDEATSLLIIAGYVGEQEKWQAFSRAWRSTLDEFQVSHFHMRDIRNGRHPLYRHLSMSRRRELVRHLIELVANTAALGSLSFLRPAEYKAVTNDSFRGRYGSPYGFLVTLALIQLDAEINKGRTSPATTDVFVEEGHSNEKDALRLLEYWREDTSAAPSEYLGEPVETIEPDPNRTTRLRIEQIGVGSKQTMLPLHAADMLAYLASAAMSFKGDPFLTELFDELLPRIPHLSTSWNRQSLEEAVTWVQRGEDEKRAIRAGWYELKSYLGRYNVELNILPWGITFDRSRLSDSEWAIVKEKIRTELPSHRIADPE
jgi:hypothetical protein